MSQSRRHPARDADATKRSSRELRHLAGAVHRLVAHQQRRLHLGVAVLGRVQVEHELAERALEPRELALQHGEAAPDSLAARSKSIMAERFADLEMLLRPVRARRHRRRRCAISTLSCSSLPTGTSSSGMLGMTAARRPAPCRAARSSASPSWHEGLDLATSAFSVFGLSPSSFCAMALPISLEAALRRSCASCSGRDARGAPRPWRSARRRRRASAADHCRLTSASARPRVLADPFDIEHGSQTNRVVNRWSEAG